jgi:hypothetical protein
MDPRLSSLVALNGRIAPSFSSFILSGRLRHDHGRVGSLPRSRCGRWPMLRRTHHCAPPVRGGRSRLASSWTVAPILASSTASTARTPGGGSHSRLAVRRRPWRLIRSNNRLPRRSTLSSTPDGHRNASGQHISGPEEGPKPILAPQSREMSAFTSHSGGSGLLDPSSAPPVQRLGWR